MAVPARSPLAQAVTRAQRAALLRGIYAIVNEDRRGDPVRLTDAILRGGARIVQYRAKSGIVDERARAMRELTRHYGALFIVNDDWRAAEKYDADGAHLGPDDAQARELPAIRAALADRLIGLSCGTPDEMRAAYASDADYAGVGSVYATASKEDAGEPLGVAGLRRVAQAAPLPAAAIGGITLGNIAQIRAAGVAMAAVLSALCNASDPESATASLVRAWNGR